MDFFTNLPWRITEPSTLDIGTNFIKEETVSKSLVYSNKFVPYEFEMPSVYSKKEMQTNGKKLRKRTKNKLPRYNMTTSTLNKKQHLLCLKALELLQSDNNTTLLLQNQEDQLIINIYNNLKFHINEEHALFLKYVEEQWYQNSLHLRTKQVLKRVFNVGKEKWMQHLHTVKSSLDQFYKIQQMIPLLIQNSTNHEIQMIHDVCLLELGTVAALNCGVPHTKTSTTNAMRINLNLMPSMKSTLTENDVMYYTKLPASKDIHAEYLAKLSECNVVITSSGLKTIIDNDGPDYNASWDIPVIIKEYLDENGKKRRIIYIDKPLPKRNVTAVDFNIKCRKILMKTNWCKNVSQHFDTPSIFEQNVQKQQELLLKTLNDVHNFKRIKRNKAVDDDDDKCSQASDVLVIDENQINEEERVVEEEEENILNVKKLKSKRRTHVHHNVTYRKWILKSNDDVTQNNSQLLLLKGQHFNNNNNIKILIRCKTDANQDSGGGVSLVPKLEYQWEYGGELLTKSELSRQWTTLYTRPSSNLLRVRMNGTNRDCIKFEHVNLNQLTNECVQHYNNFLPSNGLRVLHTICSNLIECCTVGHYLLHHEPKHGPFVVLMKSIHYHDSINNTSSSSSIFDIHNLYSEENCKIVENLKWHPIDTQLILPLHKQIGLMPGMFPPTLQLKQNAKGKKRKSSLA